MKRFKLKSFFVAMFAFLFGVVSFGGFKKVEVAKAALSASITRTMLTKLVDEVQEDGRVLDANAVLFVDYRFLGTGINLSGVSFKNQFDTVFPVNNRPDLVIVYGNGIFGKANGNQVTTDTFTNQDTEETMAQRLSYDNEADKILLLIADDDPLYAEFEYPYFDSMATEYIYFSPIDNGDVIPGPNPDPGRQFLVPLNLDFKKGYNIANACYEIINY